MPIAVIPGGVHTAWQGPGRRMLNPVLNLAFIVPYTPSSFYYMCIYSRPM